MYAKEQRIRCVFPSSIFPLAVYCVFLSLCVSPSYFFSIISSPRVGVFSLFFSNTRKNDQNEKKIVQKIIIAEKMVCVCVWERAIEIAKYLTVYKATCLFLTTLLVHRFWNDLGHWTTSSTTLYIRDHLHVCVFIFYRIIVCVSFLFFVSALKHFKSL